MIGNDGIELFSFFLLDMIDLILCVEGFVFLFEMLGFFLGGMNGFLLLIVSFGGIFGLCFIIFLIFF